MQAKQLLVGLDTRGAHLVHGIRPQHTLVDGAVGYGAVDQPLQHADQSLDEAGQAQYICDVAAVADERNGTLILLSAIDNLVKGAAGQAVQNMNLMFDFEETAGLVGVPFPL